jgi:hypothetical protein
MSRRGDRGLSKALEVVEALPRRPWSKDRADDVEACAARAYNAGLWDARAAIVREIAHPSPPNFIVPPEEHR